MDGNRKIFYKYNKKDSKINIFHNYTVENNEILYNDFSKIKTPYLFFIKKELEICKSCKYYVICKKTFSKLSGNIFIFDENKGDYWKWK